jgi:hypothetical protein
MQREHIVVVHAGRAREERVLERARERSETRHGRAGRALRAEAAAADCAEHAELAHGRPAGLQLHTHRFAFLPLLLMS